MLLAFYPTALTPRDKIPGHVDRLLLLLINEEGKLINLPLNPEATALWRATFDNDNYITGRKDFVVGPAILIKKDALKHWAA